ncbi:MAG: hypothetical protein UZ12_BCD005002681 [Bacteroidetes bacterium OLB12]|nr:MAG: hypothetical protein UZ12_BCD005002681 [Bacteroidetes bacterium OLB12]
MDATLIISDNKMRAMELKPSRFNKSGKRKKKRESKSELCGVYPPKRSKRQHAQNK